MFLYSRNFKNFLVHLACAGWLAGLGKETTDNLTSHVFGPVFVMF